jgi:signal transduction histidine kinase
VSSAAPMISISVEDDLRGPQIVASDDARRSPWEYRGLVNRTRRLVSAWARTPTADIFLALVLAAYYQFEIWWPSTAVGVGAADVTGAKSVLVPTALLVTLPLILRRRFPFAVLCVVMGASAAQGLLTTPVEGLAGGVAVVVAVYSLAAHTQRARAVTGLLVALVAAIASDADAADFAFTALVIGGTWLVGRALRSARLRAGELEALTNELAAEREERARLAVASERARIARELHDVVAHSVSTMVVQAEAGEALLEREPKRAREAFEAIQGTGREALAEMRRLLGLLRQEDRELALAPQPSLANLENLLARVREAGVPVELEVDGQPRQLPTGLDLSAYRIVQEALTNTLKHGGRARAWVVVRYGAKELEVEISDDGHSGENGANHGHGIAGMRERVTLFGGELESGRHAGGGYVVRARLPLEG